MRFGVSIKSSIFTSYYLTAEEFGDKAVCMIPFD